MDETTLVPKSMARYCEPYFKAIAQLQSGDIAKEVIDNRLQLLQELSAMLMKNFEDCVITLEHENPLELLIDHVSPSQIFVDGDDHAAFARARSLVNTTLFQAAGIFFQEVLLRPLAGGNEISVEDANHRSNIVAILENVFRLNPKSGIVQIRRQRPHSDELETITLPPLSDTGSKVAKFISQPEIVAQAWAASSSSSSSVVAVPLMTVVAAVTETDAYPDEPANTVSDDAESSEPSRSPAQLKKAKKPKATAKPKAAAPAKKSKKATAKKDAREEEVEQEPEEKEEEEEEIVWTLDHAMVGRNVGGYFADDSSSSSSSSRNNKKAKKPVPVMKFFSGVIEKYAAPSKAGEEDQLYHVKWSDGDEADMTEEELTAALDIYKSNVIDWVSEHATIGTNVAAKFMVADAAAVEDEQPSKKRGRPSVQKVEKIMIGKVEKYAAPSEEGASDQLYHVVWQDDDNQDMDEAEFQAAVALYNDMH